MPVAVPVPVNVNLNCPDCSGEEVNVKDHTVPYLSMHSSEENLLQQGGILRMLKIVKIVEGRKVHWQTDYL